MLPSVYPIEQITAPVAPRENDKAWRGDLECQRQSDRADDTECGTPDYRYLRIDNAPGLRDESWSVRKVRTRDERLKRAQDDACDAISEGSMWCKRRHTEVGNVSKLPNRDDEGETKGRGRRLTGPRPSSHPPTTQHRKPLAPLPPQDTRLNERLVELENRLEAVEGELEGIKGGRAKNKKRSRPSPTPSPAPCSPKRPRTSATTAWPPVDLVSSALNDMCLQERDPAVYPLEPPVTRGHLTYRVGYRSK
ncbi:hypothetical protein FB45DRAFT_1002310 [Roridomyces roridus]|uniref:Uncharacterized protein n=1 Tax=Roridomyces roridus TaxID=1738132 RepID=A0AAD7C113_9AGAR|nr:hypothetical protein FB45DRAFT_1002310 [Roridomyces roridus]